EDPAIERRGGRPPGARRGLGRPRVDRRKDGQRPAGDDRVGAAGGAACQRIAGRTRAHVEGSAPAGRHRAHRVRAGLAADRDQERDDAQAIGDVGYNLAVAQLRAGTTQEAARTARETRAELERRRVSPPADLLLAQAAIAYRAGAQDEALATVQDVLSRSPDP